MQRVCGIFHQTALRLCSAPELRVLSWQPGALCSEAPGDAACHSTAAMGYRRTRLKRECVAVYQH